MTWMERRCCQTVNKLFMPTLLLFSCSCPSAWLISSWNHWTSLSWICWNLIWSFAFYLEFLRNLCAILWVNVKVSIYCIEYKYWKPRLFYVKIILLWTLCTRSNKTLRNTWDKHGVLHFGVNFICKTVATLRSHYETAYFLHLALKTKGRTSLK